MAKKPDEPKSLVKKEDATPATPRVEESWETALREKAKATRSTLTVGVPRINHSAAGMALGDNPLADRVARVVILAIVWVKTWYEKPWTKGSHDTPGCYAFGMQERGLIPHPAVPKRQSETCDQCPHNKFGTATLGKGKRCGDRPTLLVIFADDLAKQGDVEVNKAIAKAQHYQLSVPPSSIKIISRYAGSLNDLTAHGDLSEAITEIGTAGLVGGGYELTFRFLGPVPTAAMPAIVKRSEKAFEVIAQPFPVLEQEEAAPQGKPIKGQAPKGRR